MKRAFSTVACMDSTWKEIVDNAARFDLAVEVRLGTDGGFLGRKVAELEEDKGYAPWLLDREHMVSHVNYS